MDKLKPILAQKFWILFSLVLMMPLVGYFMTKGTLAAKIDDRWKKLDESFKGIPVGTGVPNESWAKRLSEINEQQTLHNRRANHELWTKQKERMFWPKDVAPIMAKAEYFADVDLDQNGDQVIFKYPQSYNSQIRELWEIVDPLDDGVNLRDSDKRRKVAFAMADLHQSKVGSLGNLQPSFDDIWTAQEDIWLQTELLHAIRRMNANGISQGDAFVKQLGKIQLFGGTRATGEAASQAGGAGSGSDMGLMGMGSSFGGGQRSESSSTSSEISLSEEFVVSLDGGGGGGGGGGMPAGFGSSQGGFAEASSGEGSPVPGVGAKSDSKRYIDLDETQKYKRRGFSLKLIMDHRKVPDLIAELMNSPFPVEIVRVHQVWLSDSGNASGAGGSSGGGSGGVMPGGGIGFGGFKPSLGGESASSAPPGFAEDDGSGSGRGPSSGAPGRSGLGGAGGSGGAVGTGSAAAMADPNLAHVAIVGIWTLYLPPVAAADAGKAAPPISATPAPGLAATPENSVAPAETTTDATTTDSKPASTEPTDGTRDETKKPDDPDAPKSEPARPESTDAEKPAAETTPVKTEATDKPDSGTK